MNNASQARPSIMAHLYMWLLAGVALYAVSATLSRLPPEAYLGSSAFRQLASSWQLHLDLPIEGFAVALFLVAALPAAIGANWAPSFNLVVLSVATALVPVHLAGIWRAMRSLGVHVAVPASLCIQAVPLLCLSAIWAVFLVSKRNPSVRRNLFVAWLLAFYSTNLAAPGVVGLAF